MRGVFKRSLSILLAAVITATTIAVVDTSTVVEVEAASTASTVDTTSFKAGTTSTTVSVHDPSVVKGYVASNVTTITGITEIVGEKDSTHTKGVYFIFGSHMAWAYSWDMVNWTTFTNNINSDYATLFAAEATWSANGGTQGNSSYDVSGNIWAPDVIWNTAMQKWCMYISINGDNWYSTICMLTCDTLSGDWEYAGMVIQSGNYANTTFDYELVTANNSDADKSRYTAMRNGSLTYETNCIDPCVTYDEDGNLWLAYGSWFGGIWMIKLDAQTGLRDYTTSYSYELDVSDPYQGYRIAQGYHSSGEAAYIEYIDGYYYLFVTYGGLTAAGGYNMRVYRSETIYSGYTDESGDSAVYTSYQNNTSSSLGMRLMSYYKWSFQTYAQVAQGHNSVYYDSDEGKIFLVYHCRTNDGTEGHTVKVHELFVNEDGWLVTAAFAYDGTEALDASDNTTANVAGYYEVLLHTSSIDYANLAYVEPQNIKLNTDGTVTGDMTGTWSLTEDSSYITITIGSETYKGVTLYQTIEGSTTTTMTFTAVGSSNELALWGYRYTSEQALKDDAESITLPAQTLGGVTLSLASTGDKGSTITWSSSDTSVISNSGVVSTVEENTTVTLTATISNETGSEEVSKQITVIGESSYNSDGSILIWSDSSTYTLTGATQGKYSFVNYFNSEIGTYGIDLSNGIEIEFTVNATTSGQTFANIWSFNTGSASGNLMYFTGGSYLGYNATGGYFDANIDSTNWVAGTDYIGQGTNVTFKVVITPTTYEVYADGVLVYSMSTVEAGTTSGKNSIDSMTSVLTYLDSLATEFDLGWGDWWNSAFKGKISNISFTVLSQQTIEGFAYTADYDYYGGSVKDWTSISASTSLSIASDSTHGNYLSFEADASATGNRSAYTFFDEDAQLSGTYCVSVDVQLTAGTVGNRSISTFAIMGTDASGYTNSADITSGYILKLGGQTYQTGDDATAWVINDDTSNVVYIPAGAWVNITAMVDTEAGTAYILITDESTTYYSGTVIINGSGTLGGLFILRGRGYGTASVDNIYVSKKTIINAASIDLSSASYTYDGTAKTPTATVTFAGETLTQGTDYTVSYSNNTNAGTATVTISGTGDYIGTLSKTFTISKASQSVSLSSSSSVSIVYKKTSTISAKSTGGGSLTYSSSNTSVATVSSAGKITATGAGTATITIKAAATDNYNSASTTVKVTVTKASQTIKTAFTSMTLYSGSTTNNYAYIKGTTTGNGTVKYKSSNTKVVKVSSTGKITAVGKGTATITVSCAATNNYSKATNKTIKITVKKLSASKVSSLTNSSSKKLKIKWKKVSTATGYQIQYSTSSKFTSSKTKTVTISKASTTSKTISGLKKGKTYYVRIRTYKTVGGKTYSSWSAVKKITITK